MGKKRIAMVLLIFMMVMSFSGGVFATENTESKKDIVDTAVEAGDFKTLAAALEKAGLVETLKRGRTVYCIRSDR